ncbi:MAG: DUF523 domain-containing protein, partial [Asgard group archaeon]|nr:DUF523 domain-containing protein [Asgard group archaeon]
MEKNKIKPIILVSSCLGFEATRYDGNILKSPLIERLRNGKYVKFITVCPEVAIGLGIPRETLRLVNKEEKIRLIQPETGKDLTEKMLSFSEKFISNLIADGFIFRADSPSMGPDHVKVYDKENGWFAKRIGSGLFTYEIIKAFEGYPLQDDKRLRHPKIQENFLTKLYTYARLRLAFDSKNLESL